MPTNTLHDLISILYVLSSCVCVGAFIYSTYLRPGVLNKNVLMALCILPLGMLLGVHGFIEFSSTWSQPALLLVFLGIAIVSAENNASSAVKDGIDKYYSMKNEVEGIIQTDDGPPKTFDPTVSTHEYFKRAQQHSISLLPFLVAAPVTLFAVKPEIDHPLLTLSLLTAISCIATVERSRDLLRQQQR
jgi:hypothetical protein